MINRGRSVGIATGWAVGVLFPVRHEIFIFCAVSRPALSPSQTLNQLFHRDSCSSKLKKVVLPYFCYVRGNHGLNYIGIVVSMLVFVHTSMFWRKTKSVLHKFVLSAMLLRGNFALQNTFYFVPSTKLSLRLWELWYMTLQMCVVDLQECASICWALTR
jgi:hypothetical protein